MHRLLFYLCFACPCFLPAQYQFNGTLSKENTNQHIYLSLIEDYRKTGRTYNSQIIQKATVDSLGSFIFEGDVLSQDNSIYSIHIDNCNASTSGKTHFLQECPYSQRILFIAKNTDTVALPLLDNNQPFCSIVSTNPKSNLLLEIEGLKEEMALDFIDAPNTTAQTLTFKKWFKKFQEFGQNSDEPLAELYIFEFLTDRSNETHEYYLQDVLNNTYYQELAKRLASRHPDSKLTVQYQRELATDQLVLAPRQQSLLPYAVAGGLLFLVGVFVFKRKSSKKSKQIQVLETLTPQEKTVLGHIVDGKSNKEIAIELFISVSTVKTHINNLYKKLTVSSRDELITMFS